MEMNVAIDVKGYEVGNFADKRLKKQERSFTLSLYRNRRYACGNYLETGQEKFNLDAGWLILK